MHERIIHPTQIFVNLILTLMAILFLVGCASSQARYTSNMIEFLYPQKEGAEEKVPTATLPVPFKVGIAFVPDVSSTTAGTARRALVLSEKQKADLMEKIATVIRTYPFIKDVESIPSQYLVPKGGFANLDKIRAMYGIEAIVLLSYDQLQHTDEGMLSMTYWTIIGAYIVEGEKNDTSTMTDAAIFHIPSRKMLFRCAGTSHVNAKSTFVNLSEQLRKDSYEGFEKAIGELTGNLRSQLAQFSKKFENSPKEYKINE